ncbi:MAG: hypothetical protein AAGD06_07470 [Acidobacteriota bacterium]
MSRYTTFRIHLALLGLVLFGGLATSAGAQSLAITFDGQDVVATGLAPQAEVAWIGGGQFLDRTVPTLFSGTHWAADDNGDGEVRWTQDHPVPNVSVWAVVDLDTGKAAAASPPAAGLREAPFPGVRISQGALRTWGRLAVEAWQVQVLLVRPGKGAWSLWATEGTRDDEDGEADGWLTLETDRFEPLGATAGDVGDVQEGDLLTVFDVEAVRLSTHTVEASDFVDLGEGG